MGYATTTGSPSLSGFLDWQGQGLYFISHVSNITTIYPSLLTPIGAKKGCRANLLFIVLRLRQGLWKTAFFSSNRMLLVPVVEERKTIQVPHTPMLVLMGAL